MNESGPEDHGRRPPGNGRERPPRLATALLWLFTPAEDRDALLGDLAEEYRRHRLAGGRRPARRWYRRQALRSLLPGLERPRTGPGPDPDGEGTMASLWQDTRYALRSLARAPAFALLVVVTLALAIGVNSAIFSMVSAVFLSDLPFEETDDLVFVFAEHPERGIVRQVPSLRDLLAMRERVDTFRAVAGVRQRPAVLTGLEEPLRIHLAEGTADLFEVWGTRTALGRGFLPGEDRPGAEPVAMLSHGMWERRFDSDPDVLGTTIEIDGYPTVIVGVMEVALEFGDLSNVDVWMPLPLEENAPWDRREVWISARLAPGVTLGQAQQEVAALAAELQRDQPDTHAGWILDVQSFNEGLASEGFWTILTMLGITVLLVLAIACSNVATMMLARARARTREIAIRGALGAGRGRVLRMLLAEGIVLSLAAGLLGLLVARVFLRGLTWLAGEAGTLTTFMAMLEIDGSVLLFTLVVSMLAPLLFALAPALRLARRQLSAALREGGGRTGEGPGALGGRRFLVGLQVALALGLMAVAALLIQSMIEVRSVDLGYDPDEILTMRVDLPEGKYRGDEERMQVFRSVMSGVRARPEVEAAAWVSRRPILGGAGSDNFVIDGRPVSDPERAPWAGTVVAGPGYLELMGLELLRGRGFRGSDTADGSPVALVNQEAVERYWGGVEPVGSRIRFGADGPWLQVVGVVSTLVQADPDDPAYPLIYRPLEQSPRPGLALMVRPRGEMAAAAAAVRAEVWAVDPDQPVDDVRTMAQIFADTVAAMDAILAAFSALALFALVMSAAGIYGVMSYAVARRSREFGIRMALGARAGDVRSMVLRNSGRLVAAGVAFGLVGAFVLARLLASGVTEVDAGDPLIYVSVAALLAAVAMLSAWIPAIRATRVDPIDSLRAE